MSEWLEMTHNKFFLPAVLLFWGTLIANFVCTYLVANVGLKWLHARKKNFFELAGGDYFEKSGALSACFSMFGWSVSSYCTGRLEIFDSWLQSRPSISKPPVLLSIPGTKSLCWEVRSRWSLLVEFVVCNASCRLRLCSNGRSQR